MAIADGAPAIDQRVFLHRDSTWGEAIGNARGYHVALLNCLLEELDTVGSCDAYRTTTTDDEGAFVFSLLGDETKNEFGQRLGFEVSINNGHAGLSGAVTTTRFEIESEEISLGELELWPSGPGVNASETEVLVDWSSLGVQEDNSWTTQVRFFVVQDSFIGLDQLAGLLWAEQLADEQEKSLTLPLQVLQDQEIVVRIQDYTRNTVRTSPMVRIQGSLTPVSRGAQCVFATSLETRTDSPCRLTDGDFLKVFEGAPKVCVEKESDASTNTDEARREIAPLSQCAESGFEEVIIDLGSSAMRSELFLHASAVGLPVSLVVSVSEDGIAFEDLADEVLAFSRMPIGRKARFIRFRRDVAIGEDAVGVLEFFVNEISVF